MGAATIITDNIDLSHLAVGFEPTIERALLDWHWAGGSEAATLRNQWTRPGSVGDATRTGAVTYAANYMATKSGTDFITTNTTDELYSNLTYWIVAATDDTLNAAANRPCLIGNFISPRGGSLILLEGSSSAPTAKAFEGFDTATPPAVLGPVTTMNGPSTPSLAAPTPSNFALYFAVFTSGVGFTLYDKTRGTGATTAQTVPRLRNPLDKIRVGDGVFASLKGTAKIAGWGIYGDALTPSEIDTLTTQDIRPFMAYRGVTI